MTTTINISDDLAALLEERVQAGAYASAGAAAEALILHALGGNESEDHNNGHSVDELRRLIDEADASDEWVAWDAAAVRKEILSRYQNRQR